MNAKLTKTQQEVLDRLTRQRDKALNAGSYENYYKGAFGTTTFEEFVNWHIENDKKRFGKVHSFDEMAKQFIDNWENLCKGIGLTCSCVNTRTLEAMEKKGVIKLVWSDGWLDEVNLL